MKQLRIAANYFKRKKLVGKEKIAKRTQLATQKTAATRKSKTFMKKKLAEIEQTLKAAQQKKRNTV